MTAQERGSRADFDLPRISAAAKQGPAHLIVAAPLAEALARGLAVIQCRADNLCRVPIYGPAALGVTPRIGDIWPRKGTRRK